MSQIYEHATDDPFVITDEKSAALYAEIHPALSKLETQAWPALQARTSELRREVDGAIGQLSRFKEDVRARPELRADYAAAFDKFHGEARAKAEKLGEDSQAVLGILRAEVMDQARPKVTPEREAFVRQDLAALLDASSDPLQQMLDIAAGDHRDRAALVVSDFADRYLQRLPDKSSRERFREGLRASAIEGSLKHGTESERAAARAVKEILPRVSGWVAARTVPAMARLKGAAALRP